jgi:hypothetical protein
MAAQVNPGVVVLHPAGSDVSPDTIARPVARFPSSVVKFTVTACDPVPTGALT